MPVPKVRMAKGHLPAQLRPGQVQLKGGRATSMLQVVSLTWFRLLKDPLGSEEYRESVSAAGFRMKQSWTESSLFHYSK